MPDRKARGRSESKGTNLPLEWRWPSLAAAGFGRYGESDDVFFTSSTNGWAVGEHGVMVRTRDGGNTWGDVTAKTTHRLEKIVFNGGRGWVVGFGGTVLTYDLRPRQRGAGSETCSNEAQLKFGVPTLAGPNGGEEPTKAGTPNAKLDIIAQTFVALGFAHFGD